MVRTEALPRIRQSPTDPGFVQDPYPFYERARALGEIVWWEDYDLPVAVSAAAVNTVLKHRDMGREPIEPPVAAPHTAEFYAIEAHSMLELEPPRHTRLRGLVLRAPPKLVTVAIVFAGIISNTASEVGYVVLIPLAGILFAGLDEPCSSSYVVSPMSGVRQDLGEFEIPY